ncbi:MAG TPA: hypothetical protein VF989_10880, partial [Polyangiaceae bacterium]
MRRSKPRKGLRRVARWLVRGASAVLALVLAACLLLLALVNTELGRGELVQRVNLLLASTFRGELRIRSVGRVGFGGAADVDGVVIDAAGRRVLEVEGLEVEMPVVPLVWQLLVSRPETTRIDIDRVEARYVRVKLIDDGEGAPTLAQAFQPRRPSAPSQGGAAHVAVRAFELQHGWVHGRLSGFAVDADIDDVLASLTVDSAAVSLDVERARLRARGLPRKLELAGTASLRLELPLEAAPRERLIEAKFGGGSAGASVSLTAKLAGEAVTGTLSVPALEPAALRKLLPESKLQAPVALEARLAGTLQNPKLDAEIGLREGTVRAHAAVDVEKKSADVTLDVDALDPSLLDPRAPAGAVSFSAEAKVSFDREAAVMARYRIRAPPASVGVFELPPADVDGSFELDRDGAWRTDGKAHLLEPGARTEIAYAVRQGGARAAPLVEVSSSTELDEPRRLVNLASGARVSGHLETRVRFDAAEGELRATARGSFAEAKVREVSARRVELDASAVGRVESPRIELALRLASLRFRGEGYEQGRVKLWGTPERLAVTASFGRPVRLTLHTELTLEPRFRVRGTELVFHGDGRGPVRVSARSLGADDGGIRGRDVRIETPGGGVAEASFEFGNTLRALELRADDFDLRQAFESLDLPLGKEVELPSGKVSLSARYRQTRAGPSGFVRGTFRDLEYGPLRGLRGKVDAEIEEGMLDGKLDAHYQGSRLRATFDRVEVRRIPPEALDLEQFRGRVTVVANLVLDGLAPLLPLTALPLESASGKATLRFELARGEGESGRVALDVTTESLALVGERRSAGASKDPELAKNVAPWSLSGVDVDLGAAASEADRRLSLRSRFFDGMGDLARGTAEIRLPESTARRFASWPDAWRRANVSVSLGVVPRAVTEWPPMLRLAGVDGVVSASAQLEGTYAAPELRVMANIAR